MPADLTTTLADGTEAELIDLPTSGPLILERVSTVETPSARDRGRTYTQQVSDPLVSGSQIICILGDFNGAVVTFERGGSDNWVALPNQGLLPPPGWQGVQLQGGYGHVPEFRQPFTAPEKRQMYFNGGARYRVVVTPGPTPPALKLLILPGGPIPVGKAPEIPAFVRR
jgi:hypothetical protein